MDELRPGLWRWTTRHPAAVEDPEPESADDWPPHVGSVAYAAPEHLVIIDPLVDDSGWQSLDELVARHRRPVVVLTTVRWHGRSSAEARARYDATADVPPGVEAVQFEREDETMYWIPQHRALVPGDRLLGTAGGLRVCPDSWLDYIERNAGYTVTGAELRTALRRLLDLPVELVLVSHGEPVLADGRAAIAHALT